MCLPPEIFQTIARFLLPSHCQLLRLAMTCRASRDGILRCHSLWYQALLSHSKAHFGGYGYSIHGPAIVRSIPMMPYPNFKVVIGDLRATTPPPYLWYVRRQQWPHVVGASQTGEFTREETAAFAEHAVTRARLEHSLSCGLCGCKRGHLPVWGLGQRVCPDCLKANLVSSAALLLEYGYNFAHHADELAGRVYYFRQSHNVRFSSQNLTHNPVDFTVMGKVDLVYFWMPHLAKVVDLEACRRAFKDPERRAAASDLAARARALATRLALGQKGGTFARAVAHKFYTTAKPESGRQGRFWTAAPLKQAEASMADYASRHGSVLLAKWKKGKDAEHEEVLAGRALLQRSFVAFRGRLSLPRVPCPDRVLRFLRTYEATRPTELLKPVVPSYYQTDLNFRQWQDLKPLYAE